MIGIYSRIENIYQGTNKYSLDKVFYNPIELNKRFSVDISRYKVSLLDLEYKPYTLDPDTYINLFKNIDIVDVNCGSLTNSNESNEKIVREIIIEDKSGKFISTIPEYIDNLMEGDDITPGGLLSLRVNSTYEDKKYKDYIESEFLNQYFYFNDDLEIYILKEMYLNSYGLSIKDIINTINVLKSYNKKPITPYSYIMN